MKKYVRPAMEAKSFNSRTAVAVGCYQETTTKFDPQTVDCIIEEYDTIFQTGTSGCTNSVDSGYLGTYNGQYYFVWYTGNQPEKIPTAEQTALLSAIEAAVGANVAIGQPGWHAGPVTATFVSEWNSTS